MYLAEAGIELPRSPDRLFTMGPVHSPSVQSALGNSTPAGLATAAYPGSPRLPANAQAVTRDEGSALMFVPESSTLGERFRRARLKRRSRASGVSVFVRCDRYEWRSEA